MHIHMYLYTADNLITIGRKPLVLLASFPLKVHSKYVYGCGDYELPRHKYLSNIVKWATYNQIIFVIVIKNLKYTIKCHYQEGPINTW